jgi:two-component system cell cycle sensor histidine kinase/response regulator CckA
VLNRLDGSGAMGAAEKAEVRFARFFHNTPLAIATVDEDGGITGNNATFARTFADVLKGAEGTSRALPEMIQDKDRAVVRRALADAARNRGDIAPVDVALVEPSQRSARLFVTPAGVARDGVAQDGSGAEGARREAAIVYLLETTEQRALQEQFAQSQKMQAVGQLAGGVAHDFNNVLTAIIGYSDLLLAQHRPTDPSFQDIMQIKQNANRAASLVKQLLAFSRRQTMRPQVVQLNDAVSDLMILVKRLVAEKVELDVRYGRDLWPVKADVNQLEQVIVNLAVNARDAMPNGGKLMLRTLNVPQVRCADFNHKLLPPADYVALEVEDTGTGMPPDVMEKIFEPFFTTKEVGKGTGLGLSMVYGIVKQTGGFVFVDSTVGKGTTFRVFLPRHVAEAGEAVEEMPEAAKPPEKDLTGQGTILLVEDEDAVRAFGSRALRSRGYTVLEATTGLEALEVIETGAHRIELIVSDVVMPEMDGPTLLLELKKRGLAHKFVFASGYAEDAFKKSMPDDEEFGFLPKPYTLKQLVEVVKEATGR